MQYQQARVVEEHASLPWNHEEFSKHLSIAENDDRIIRQSIRVARCECQECKPGNEYQETYDKEKFSDYRNIRPDEGMMLSDHQCMLMSSHMFGFILKDRTYGKSTTLSIA